MQSPKITFIAPVYGVEKYLNQCLDSILNQTFTDWECLLVDDGSPDNSGAICDEYAARDSRFRVIHKANGGVSAARNDGFAQARGEYTYFVDSDDWLELDAAELLYKAAKEKNADCVMSYCEKIYPDGTSKRSAQFGQPFFAQTSEELEEIQRYVLYQPCHRYSIKETTNGYAAPWAKFVRTKKLKAANVQFDPYLNGVFDDGLWSLYVLDAIDNLLYIHEKTYNYRIVAGSLTHSFKKNAMITQERGYERIEQFLTDRDKSEALWQAYYAHVVRFFGGYLSRYYFNDKNPASANEVKKEITETLKRSPYYDAAHKVDVSILESKDKVLAFCERNNFQLGFKLYLFAKKAAGKR